MTTIHQIKTQLNNFASAHLVPHAVLLHFEQYEMDGDSVSIIKVLFTVGDEFIQAIESALPNSFANYEFLNYEEVVFSYYPFVYSGLAFEFKTTDSSGGF